MAADPQTPAPAVQWITAASTVAVALVGLDHFALIWGLIGAMGAQTQKPTNGRFRSIAALIMNTLMGALAGSALAAMFWPDVALARYVMCAIAPLVLSKYLFRFADAIGNAVESALPFTVGRVFGLHRPPTATPPPQPPAQKGSDDHV